MKYKGIKLKEFKSDKPVVFDPPKEMLVWNLDDGKEAEPILVQAYIPSRITKVISNVGLWLHCAEITEEPNPRRATNLELVKWLAQGNGVCKTDGGVTFFANLSFDIAVADTECDSYWRVRKWNDNEWHEPTVDYMGLEGK